MASSRALTREEFKKLGRLPNDRPRKDEKLSMQMGGQEWMRGKGEGEENYRG